MKKIRKSTLITISIALVIGLGLGWLIFGGSRQQDGTHEHNQTAESEDGTVWTCAMHPQIRQDKPGKCPICGMDLTPLGETTFTAGDEHTFRMTAAAAALADVQTTVVRAGREGAKEIVLTGKIEADERRIYEIPAHFHGRLEKLYVNFTGEYVSRGEVLASVYSPDLITAQQELFETLPYKESNPAMYKAARNKLKNWKIADSEINQIEQSGEVKTELLIRAHHAGVVSKRNVAVGDHFSMGDILFEVVDLSHLWVMFDAYEQHVSWIEVGDQVEFTVASLPGKSFKARLTFIDPFIDSQTRVAKVRAEVSNSGRRLKPEMFVRGTIRAETGSAAGKDLLIPESAVLWTGKRSLVYVKKPGFEQPVFEYREVELGPLTGDHFVVKKGLSAGEEVVTNGTFSIDAAAQLSGKASMMNPEGGAAPSMPGMKMDDKSGQHGKTEDLKTQVPGAFRNQLDQVIGAYLRLKDGLVAGDEKAAARYNDELLSALDKVNGDLLKGQAKTFWAEKKNLLTEHTQSGKKAQDIEAQRRHFISLTQPLIEIAQAFGPGSQKLYVDYCPMANNKQGAFWLSESKEIQNPFMPPEMSSCGEVKQEILANK